MEFWIGFARLDPGTGRESNAVSGGDEPGLFPTAGTIPTIPDDTAGASGAVFVEEPPLPAVASGTTEVDVVEPAPCGLSCDAATVARGFPLGSTNVMSSIAAALCPPL